jgi:hypothetical protein
MRKMLHLGMSAAIAATALVVLSGFGAQAGAATSTREGVQAVGKCSGPSTSLLKAQTDNGGIRVEFRVDSNAAGQRWGVMFRDNGTTVFKGAAVTDGGGTIDVRHVITDQAGPDKIQALAKNQATGETCIAQVTF